MLITLMHEMDDRPSVNNPINPSRRDMLTRGLAIAASTGLLASTAAAKLPAANSPVDENYWTRVADRFLLKDGLTYLNTGTRGPSPASVYHAQLDSIRDVNEDRLGYVRNVYTTEYKQCVRAKLANYLGCHIDEIAITNNTTEGMAIGTNGPALKPGDEIIYTNHDHSSGGQPINLRCAREGTVPVMVDLSDARFHPASSPDEYLEAIEHAITPRTRLISFCHINYTDGSIMPVREICDLARSKGILTLVDGAHPPGMLEMNLEELGCDMYAGACHKWMLAGMLTGFLYIRKDLQDRIWPSVYSGPVLGKNMYGEADDSEKGKTAERYETHGSVNYASLVSIEAALDFHNAIGPAAIESRVRHLAGKARSALLAMDNVELYSSDNESLSAGIVSFRIKGIPTRELSNRLYEKHHIYIREVTHEAINWDANRLSLHIMASGTQVDNSLGIIGEIANAS